MKERQFFFASDLAATQRIISDLKEFGIPDSDLHVIAHEEASLGSLPEADITHRSDIVDAAKRGAATGSAIGLLGGAVAVTALPAALTLSGGAVLAGTALATALGTWFSTLVGVSVPNQDVDDYRHRIERGEFMIIVDCEPQRQPQLIAMLTSRHGDAILLQGNLDAA